MGNIGNIGKGAFNWSKVKVGTFVMLRKISISNKCHSFKSKNPEKYNVALFPQNYEAAQLFSKLIIRNTSWTANHHIRMISEESCDTEDWSNDAENSALITAINYILQYIQTENSYYKCK